MSILTMKLPRYIYSMFIAIDANFRLKRRAVSSDARDPALSSGMGYFVEDFAYRRHVLNHADEQDVRSHSLHLATHLTWSFTDIDLYRVFSSSQCQHKILERLRNNRCRCDHMRASWLCST